MSVTEPQVGDLFAGKFRIERLLGKGGMGAVYAAQHEGLRQRFAIKVLLGEIAGNPEAVGRFMNEASSAALIQNEHVARVTDVSKTDDGNPYMVMEYLEGKDLSQLLELRKALLPMEAVHYVLQAIEAVHGAHESRIVHRDLKPANLFLARKPDGTDIIKVLDFGISKVQGDGNASLTSTRSMLGSPLYMSPEQLRSSKTVDSRSDIWSLGIILYELLSGSVPYSGEGIGELFAAILEEEPIPLRQHNPQLSPELEQVVMGCLRKKREERFQTVADLAVALAPFGPQDRPSALALRTMRAGGGAGLPFTGAPFPMAASSSGPVPVAGGATGMRPPVPSFAGVTGSQSSYHAAKPSVTSAPPLPAAKRSSAPAILGVAALLLVGAGVGVFAKVRGFGGSRIEAPSTSASVTASAVGGADSAAVSADPSATTAGADPALAATSTGSVTAAVPSSTSTGAPTGAPTGPSTGAPTATAAQRPIGVGVAGLGQRPPVTNPVNPRLPVSAAAAAPKPSATTFVPGGRND